jgi:hypothetical protein
LANGQSPSASRGGPWGTTLSKGAGDPLLEGLLMELTGKTGVLHVYGDEAAAKRQAPSAPNKAVAIWQHPPPGEVFLLLSSPVDHRPEEDIYAAASETLLMHVWGIDTAACRVILERIWRLGFEVPLIDRNGRSWLSGLDYGSVSRASAFVPSSGVAWTDRVTVRYNLARQQGVFAAAESIALSGDMLSPGGTSLGEVP